MGSHQRLAKAHRTIAKRRVGLSLCNILYNLGVPNMLMLTVRPTSQVPNCCDTRVCLRPFRTLWCSRATAPKRRSQSLCAALESQCFPTLSTLMLVTNLFLLFRCSNALIISNVLIVSNVLIISNVLIVILMFLLFLMFLCSYCF